MKQFQKRLRPTFFLFLCSIGLFLASCGDSEKIYDVSDTQWRIAVFWDDGINTTMTLDFNEDLTLLMTNDTAAFDGSWSRNGQVISWLVDIPTRQINAKCTVDKKKIEGTLSDENELTAIFTGDKQ